MLGRRSDLTPQFRRIAVDLAIRPADQSIASDEIRIDYQI